MEARLMGISLRPETEKIIEDRMARGGYPTADDVVLAALALLEGQDDVVEIDEATRAALDRADGEIQRGAYRDFAEVAAELRRKFPRR